MHHYRIVVKGKVQGVFFRYSAKEVAEKLGIKGYVKNLPDGSVLIEAEGGEESLEKLKDWCHTGPRNAKVSDVSVEKLPAIGFTGFLITK